MDDVRTGRWLNVLAGLLAGFTALGAGFMILSLTAAAAPQAPVEASDDSAPTIRAALTDDESGGQGARLVLPDSLAAGATTTIGVELLATGDEDRLLAVGFRFDPAHELVGSVYATDHRALVRESEVPTVRFGITVHEGTGCTDMPGDIHVVIHDLAGEVVADVNELAPPIECLEGPPPAPSSVHEVEPSCDDDEGDGAAASAAVTPVHCDRPPRPAPSRPAGPTEDEAADDDAENEAEEDEEAEDDAEGDPEAGPDAEEDAAGTDAEEDDAEDGADDDTAEEGGADESGDGSSDDSDGDHTTTDGSDGGGSSSDGSTDDGSDGGGSTDDGGSDDSTTSDSDTSSADDTDGGADGGADG